MADKEKNGTALAVKRTEWPPVLTVEDELDRVFDQMLGGFSPGAFMRLWGRPSTSPAVVWVPEVDVFEREGKVVVRADLPGVKKGDIEVEVVQNALIIRGGRTEEKEERKKNYYRSERFSGKFSRTIRIPEGVDPGSIEATYKDGVLEVSIPCPVGAAQSKKVKVNVK